MWNIAHNLGGFSAPILAGSAARSYGWKWGETTTHDQAAHVAIGCQPFTSCCAFYIKTTVCKAASSMQQVSSVGCLSATSLSDM